MPEAFVVLNPEAGSSAGDAAEPMLRGHLSDAGWTYHICTTSDREEMSQALRAVMRGGTDVCVAAGGDGTVSTVAGALAHSSVPLAIIPLGTGNILARELGVPPEPEAALSLLLGSHTTRAIDALQLDDRLFFVAVGVGVSAVMMRDTPQLEKGRLGRLAYLWTGLKALVGLQPRSFTIVVDGQARNVRASEVMVANVGAVGDPYMRWGAQVRPDDGVMDVCVIRARTVWDFVQLAWYVLTRQQRRASNLSFFAARESVRIDSPDQLPVQGDGDPVAHTPVQVHIVPRAVTVIVPPAP